MNQVIAGFELPEGKTINDLEHWPSFAEWYRSVYGFMPGPNNLASREKFEAYVAGAYWESQRGRLGPSTQTAIAEA